MTREEAISLLTQVNKILVNSNSWLENTHELLNMAFDMAIKALEQEPRWIPVSEKLPEDDELYLVYTKEQPFVCPFKDGEFFIDEVIAWMPLPQAYSEVEE